jgi:sugar lactone lactonase YvrE
VTTWAGSGDYATLDGAKTAAKFQAPRGMAITGSTLYVADPNGHCLRKLDMDGNVTTLFDAAGKTPAGLTGPTDVAVDAQGNAYVTLPDLNKVARISPDGLVTVIAGGTQGARDGAAVDAQFNKPTGLAIDAQGNVYVADTGNHRIRLIAPDGTVTTIAGGASGHQDGAGETALFKAPYDIEVDDVTGKLYVSENEGHRVRVLSKR